MGCSPAGLGPACTNTCSAESRQRFWRNPDTLAARGSLGCVNTKQNQIVRALSPLPLFVILGWCLGAWGLERRGPLGEVPVEVREIPGVGPIPEELGVQPLELRQVPGVGRTRSRDLARGLWGMELGPSALNSASSMERVAGIGPVTGGAVEHWAASRASGAYTGAQEIHPAIACLPPKSIRVHPKRALARPPAGTTPSSAPRLP